MENHYVAKTAHSSEVKQNVILFKWPHPSTVVLYTTLLVLSLRSLFFIKSFSNVFLSSDRASEKTEVASLEPEHTHTHVQRTMDYPLHLKMDG